VNAVLVPHILAGLAAVLAGYAAVAAPKGGRLHRLSGSVFFVAMLVLGVTAAILEPFRTPEPGSPVGGILVCYFVATSWSAARRRGGTTGKFEIVACAVALGGAALGLLDGLTGAQTPAGRGPVFAFAAICLVAGLLDLNVILRQAMTARQRIARHLWRMCFAFFIATGSFFLGQQDIMPEAVRGSPVLWVLALAPIGFMLFWLVRLRLGKRVVPKGTAAPPASAAC
jgi:uncharacterized membrane protein